MRLPWLAFWHGPHTHSCIHTHTRSHTHPHTHAHIRTHTHTHVHAHAHMQTHNAHSIWGSYHTSATQNENLYFFHENKNLSNNATFPIFRSSVGSSCQQTHICNNILCKLVSIRIVSGLSLIVKFLFWRLLVRIRRRRSVLQCVVVVAVCCRGYKRIAGMCCSV